MNEIEEQLRRYADAAEAHVAPTPQRPASRPTGPRRHARPWLVAAAVLLVVGGGVGALVVTGLDGGERIDTTPAETPSTTTVPTTTIPAEQVVIEFRPVLELIDPTISSQGPTPAAERSPAAEVVLFGDDESGSRYLLGPAALTRGGIESAEAAEVNGDWTLTLVLRTGPEGIDTFNALAQQCFDGSATCPGLGSASNGTVGIVVGDTVVSAPMINQAEFEADGISISGSFTEEQARELARQLDGTD